MNKSKHNHESGTFHVNSHTRASTNNINSQSRETLNPSTIVKQEMLYSGRRDDVVNFTKGTSGQVRQTLVRRAFESQDKAFQSNYMKALYPNRKTGSDDESSLKLARYLERINDHKYYGNIRM